MGTLGPVASVEVSSSTRKGCSTGAAEVSRQPSPSCEADEARGTVLFVKQVGLVDAFRVDDIWKHETPSGGGLDLRMKYTVGKLMMEKFEKTTYDATRLPTGMPSEFARDDIGEDHFGSPMLLNESQEITKMPRKTVSLGFSTTVIPTGNSSDALPSVLRPVSNPEAPAPYPEAPVSNLKPALLLLSPAEIR